jgi:hypothetical protein
MLNPASVNDQSMLGPTRQSGSQGIEYKALHMGQYGGGNVTDPAPVTQGDQGTLPADMAASARLTPQNQAFAAIQGMKDQGGGGRRSSRKMMYGGQMKMGMNGGKRYRRKSKKHGGSRKRVSRKRVSRRRKSMYGGQMASLNPSAADLSAKSANILPNQSTESGMNPEWKLAHDPKSFVPDAVKATTGAM